MKLVGWSGQASGNRRATFANDDVSEVGGAFDWTRHDAGMSRKTHLAHLWRSYEDHIRIFMEIISEYLWRYSPLIILQISHDIDREWQDMAEKKLLSCHSMPPETSKPSFLAENRCRESFFCGRNVAHMYFLLSHI